MPAPSDRSEFSLERLKKAGLGWCLILFTLAVVTYGVYHFGFKTASAPVILARWICFGNVLAIGLTAGLIAIGTRRFSGKRSKAVLVDDHGLHLSTKYVSVLFTWKAIESWKETKTGFQISFLGGDTHVVLKNAVPRGQTLEGIRELLETYANLKRIE